VDSPDPGDETPGRGRDGSPTDGDAPAAPDPEDFPNKIVIERPRLIARLEYSDSMDENPLAVRNLLLFIENAIRIPSIEVKSHPDVTLSREQKLSIFDQLSDFQITLLEESGRPVDRPILSGDVPAPSGGEKAIATFEVLSEETEREADDFLVLFMTGQDDFEMSPERLEVLRSYLVRGGVLFGDCASGNPDFARGFRRMVKKLFPDRPLEVLSPDHPVFSTVFDLSSLRYTGRSKPEGGIPRIEGIGLGCRTAVFFSPDAVSCGWDGHMHGEYVEYEIHYEDALRFGANLVAYALGYRELGAPLREARVFRVPDRGAAGNEVVMAQLRFRGDFDPNRYGLVNWIEFVNDNVNTVIRPDRVLVDPEKDSLFRYPFLYVSGHGTLEFPQGSAGRLQKYLEQGGVLFAEACCGDAEFDRSFRELLPRLVPDSTLEWIKPDHPIFRSFYRIESVNWRPRSLGALEKRLADVADARTARFLAEKRIPYLEGVFRSGRAVVIYSPFDLSCAWEQRPCLICKGLSHEGPDAFRLGVNILVYLLNRR
jgi:hypothetical protein